MRGIAVIMSDAFAGNIGGAGKEASIAKSRLKRRTGGGPAHQALTVSIGAAYFGGVAGGVVNTWPVMRRH